MKTINQFKIIKAKLSSVFAFYLCLFLIFNFSLIIGTAQNLVPNPSFEIYDTCPQYPSQIRYAIPWFQPIVPAWNGSSDFYNACSSIPDSVYSVFVPNNWAGSQYARTGSGYAGNAYYGSQNKNSREFIEVKLNSQLLAGKKYCVSFYVSVGDSFKYAVDAIGAHFSTDSMLTASSADSAFIVTHSPQIENLKGNIISDTVNWTLVYGEFIAEGGEEFMIIGNLRLDDSITIDTANYSANAADYCCFAYYYIDDVEVLLCDSAIGYTEINYEKDIRCYPNPVKDNLSIEITNNQNVVAQIYDPLGILVYQEKLHNYTNSIQLNNLYNGIYTLKIQFPNKTINQKLIINK